MSDRSTGLEFRVPGTPVAQPRHRASCRGGFARIYLPKDHAVHEWKRAIHVCVEREIKKIGAIEGPVRLELLFSFEAKTRASMNQWRTKKPDIDNLAKAVMDALTDAGAWQDDSQVVCMHCAKVMGAASFVNVKVAPLDFRVD